MAKAEKNVTGVTDSGGNVTPLTAGIREKRFYSHFLSLSNFLILALSFPIPSFLRYLSLGVHIINHFAMIILRKINFV